MGKAWASSSVVKPVCRLREASDRQDRSDDLTADRSAWTGERSRRIGAVTYFCPRCWAELAAGQSPLHSCATLGIGITSRNFTPTLQEDIVPQ